MDGTAKGSVSMPRECCYVHGGVRRQAWANLTLTDLSAAPGNKTSYISALMGDKNKASGVGARVRDASETKSSYTPTKDPKVDSRRWKKC